MIEREMRGGDIKSKVKKTFSFFFKKKQLPVINTSKVSKQVEKEIDKKIPADFKYNKVTAELPSSNRKSDEYNELREKLKMSLTEEEKKSTIVEDDYGYIENIDNYDRIKQKIKNKKIEIIKNRENKSQVNSIRS